MKAMREFYVLNALQDLQDQENINAQNVEKIGGIYSKLS